MASQPVRPVPNENAVANTYRALHDRCEAVLSASLSGANGGLQAKSHFFISELDEWAKVLASRAERRILDVVICEYQFALLALVQGHYSAAFKSLRLVLELSLHMVYMSAYRLEFEEWQTGRRDTEWSVLRDTEKGVLSHRFANGFFPELSDQVRHFNSLAQQLYRECSEYVHGNQQKSVQVPNKLCFDQAVFDAWHTKADLTAFVVTFALVLRFLKELDDPCKTLLEPSVCSRLGHIAAIRRRLGHAGGD